MICHEKHTMENSSWLRASMLGANDGLLSTSSLMIGVVQTQASLHSVFLIGLAGLLSGAFAMATGEYVSVSSQKDVEYENINKEKKEIEQDWEHELHELKNIYISRGLNEKLALEVSQQMMNHNALDAHLRDELGITEITASNPLQASLASALSFAFGAIIPIIISILFFSHHVTLILFFSSVITLGVFGYISSKIANTKSKKPIIRTLIFGCLSMFVTFFIGNILK